MPMIANKTPFNGSLRIHTRSMQEKTSSNQTFNDQMRLGLKSGIDLTNNAIRQVAGRIPGSAALSASLSEAAAKLNLDTSTLSGSKFANSVDMVEGGMGNLQDEMVKKNQDMLEQQWKVTKITTEYSTRSYILKAMFESLKTIGSNIR